MQGIVVSLTLCLLTVTQVASVQPLPECVDPKLENKCKMDCIPKVQRTQIKWSDVKPKSFIVRWQAVPSARCYNIELLRGYTVDVIRTVICHQGLSYEFRGLTPSTIYGVRVSAVNFNCVKGQPGVPARTRTMWAPTPPPTKPPKPTPKPGACGRGKFTCESDPNECIINSRWCDRIRNCNDGSDERRCPGGCEEIDEEFLNGNYTCSRWGSPGSVCWFDCYDGYTMAGRQYTRCNRRLQKWTFAIPVCKPESPDEITIEGVTATTITVTWSDVISAARYFLVAEKQAGKGAAKNVSIDATNCCKGTISGLSPETEYKVTVSTFDDEELQGKKSKPLFARTTSKPVEIEDDEEDDDEEDDAV